MNKNEFYFIKDRYFSNFKDKYLMKNKEVDENGKHDRPCYFIFPDTKNNDIYWLIPISSKVKKYENIYNKIAAKRGSCETIAFADVQGERRAFLMQNMCPATSDYLELYVDSTNKPVAIKFEDASNIESNAKITLAKHYKGIKTIFPNVDYIYQELEKELVKARQSINKEQERKPLNLNEYKHKANEHNKELKKNVASLDKKTQNKKINRKPGSDDPGDR